MRRIGRERDRKNMWKYRKKPLLDMLNKYSPDILCLQEDNVIQQKLLAKELDMNYFGKYSGKDTGHGTNECNSILFKKNIYLLKKDFFWLGKNMKIPSQFEKQSKYFRILIYAKLKLPNNKTINVFNTHLDHLEEARLKSIEFINKKIKKSKNYILCGDFNTNSNQESMKLLDKYFIDTMPKLRNRKTLLDWAGIFGMRIKTDYIFSNLKVKKNKIIEDTYRGEDNSKRYFSDHKPILSILEI